MSELRVSIAAARERLIEGLCSAGFEILADGTLAGNVDVGGEPVEHLITIPDDFPYAKPKVKTPGGEGGLSWHREADGGFCLWADDEASHLPWLDAADVLGRIAEWHAQDAADWPDDPPDLDLQQYWPRATGLILHDDLGPLVGQSCRVKRGPHGVYELQARLAPRKARDATAAAVVDVGELERPLHNFAELCEVLEKSEARKIEDGIKSGHLGVFLVRYTRRGLSGSLALIAEGRNPNDLVTVDTASTADEVLRLRAGPESDGLSLKRIAIVGVGAVGSSVADLLARSGAGSLTLIDADILRPGNCVRHLLSVDDVGAHKAEAVRDRLHAQPFVHTEIVARTGRLVSVDEAEALFAEHDLVIDATGNGPATALILAASKTLGRPAVTVCLQQGGMVVRVDRSPLGDGEAYEPALPAGEPTAELREGGCGDPVSPTSPWACQAAAARATGMAVDLLSGRRMYPPTLLEHLLHDGATPGATE